MKRVIFILMILAEALGLRNVAEVRADEKKDLKCESGAVLKVPGNDFASGQVLLRTDFENYSWGGAVSGKIIKKIPYDLKTGDLNYSGAVSLLNNPVLSSSISPFSLPVSSVSSITARLPDGSSWNKPLSGFVKVSGISAFYTEEKLAGVSAIGKFLSFTAVSSPQNAKKTESWYSDTPFLKDEFQTVSMVVQGLYKTKKISFLFSDGLFFQPDGKLFQVFRSENRTGPVSFSFLINPNQNLITASGKTLDEIYQFKGNIQGNSKSGKTLPCFWKYGMTFMGNLKPEDKCLELKSDAGFRFLCYLTSLNISAGGDFQIPYEEKTISLPVLNKASLSIKNGWYFSFLQPVLRGSISYVPKDDYSSYTLTENIGTSLYLSTKPSLYMNAASELKQKDGKWQGGNLDLGMSMKYSRKFFDLSGKVSWSIEF